MLYKYNYYYYVKLLTTVVIHNTFSCRSEEPGFFDGVFLAQDSEVSNFVEEVQGAVKSVSFKSG